MHGSLNQTMAIFKRTPNHSEHKTIVEAKQVCESKVEECALSDAEEINLLTHEQIERLAIPIKRNLVGCLQSLVVLDPDNSIIWTDRRDLQLLR